MKDKGSNGKAFDAFKAKKRCNHRVAESVFVTFIMFHVIYSIFITLLYKVAH